MGSFEHLSYTIKREKPYKQALEENFSGKAC